MKPMGLTQEPPGGALRALVLAGGSGTRLWPLSTDERPKPFLKLASPRSLLAETVARAEALAGPSGVWVSGRKAHAELIRKELPQVPAERLLLEPMRRSTAPAIALATVAIAAETPRAVVAVLPSDQAVRDEGAFLSALRAAAAAAAAEPAIVTLGIVPTRPETGFGYMEAGEPAAGASRRVRRFVEKPALADAQRYAASPRHFWNAGIFVYRAEVLLEVMERVAKEPLEAARAAFAARAAGDEEGFDRAFGSSPSISIDHAVMERAPHVLTVPCDCGWTDLGSWEAVYEHRVGQGDNVLEGPASAVDGSGNLVLAGDRPIRVVGLSDVAVVDSPEGLLVMKRGSSDALRKEVERMMAGGRG
jgi:mannose-1-phosphate guanylyltransferase